MWQTYARCSKRSCSIGMHGTTVALIPLASGELCIDRASVWFVTGDHSDWETAQACCPALPWRRALWGLKQHKVTGTNGEDQYYMSHLKWLPCREVANHLNGFESICVRGTLQVKSVPQSMTLPEVKIKVKIILLHNNRQLLSTTSCDCVPVFLKCLSSSPWTCRCESCWNNSSSFSTSLSLMYTYKVNPFHIHSHLFQPLFLFTHHPSDRSFTLVLHVFTCFNPLMPKTIIGFQTDLGPIKYQHTHTWRKQHFQQINCM